MLKKLIAAICVLIFLLLGGAVAATTTETKAPAVRVCTVSHDALPQHPITTAWGKEIIGYLKIKKLPVFGTAQDKDGFVLIWYLSDTGHTTVILTPQKGGYQIVHSEDGWTIYQSALAAGAFKRN